MIDNAGRVYIQNGSLEAAESMEEVDAQKFKVVYEVVRIMDRTALYLEEHYARLERSLAMLGLASALDYEQLKEQIRRLVDANHLQNCNVKLAMYQQEEQQNYMLYISKSYYPSAEEIRTGVPTGLFQWVRHDPNAKVVNQKYKEEVSRRMKETGAFELLLVNEEGKITEGSKSNVFFIKSSKAYTSPGHLVLKGITRQYIMEACKRLGVEVVEELTSVEELESLDGLFISGTSIKVLPVSSVDDRKFSSSTNPTLVAIRDEFDRMIEEYINSQQ